MSFNADSVLSLISRFITIAGCIEEYGPLITIRSRLETIVIIGRYKAVVDIMKNQGKSLADRPRMVAAGDIFGGGVLIGFEPFGERPKAAEAYQPLQMSHAKNTILDILDDPYDFQNHVTTYAATTIMKVACGKTTPTSATDPEVIEVSQLGRMLREIMRPGAYLVDSIPWLKYLPWYGRDLKQGFERSKKLNMGHLNRVKEQMQSNVDIGPSFAKCVLESSYLHGLTEAEMASLAGVFFGSGSNTLTSYSVVFEDTCLQWGERLLRRNAQCSWQRLASQRSKRKSSRGPTFADQESLPHMHAFISEALRWRPLTSNGEIGSPNDQRRDLGNGDYGLRKPLAISRDPEVYPEPYVFKPQRWIDDQGCLRDDIIFCLRVCVCPGQHVVNRSIFISSLLILWALRLALDPLKTSDDMGYMNGEMSKRPCAIEFETRISETELRHMMQNYPEVA
ncbi:cytochrome P450 [Suillus ampliporus]|nr:cytochrome P450 [Suillus ampliporus]